MSLSPAERSERARIAAYAMHSKHDPVKTTESARAAFRAQFLNEVDPSGQLRLTNPAEAERRAEAARRRWYAAWRFKAMKVKKAREENDPGVEPAPGSQQMAEGQGSGRPSQ